MDRVARWSLVVAAISLAIFGAYSFVFPEAASASFPWRVGPFLAMTIGGWAIGTAAMSAATARDWRLPIVLPALANLWLFGVGQTIVVVLFADKLVLTPLAFPYLIGLAALIVSAGTGAFWLLSSRPNVTRWRERISPIVWFFVVGFIGLVGALAFLTAQAREGGATTTGGFFPEPMGLFSARAFAAFFFALTVGAVVLLVTRSIASIRFYALTGLCLIVPITLAAFVYLRLFDFGRVPGHSIYVGAYLLAGVVAVLLVVSHRSRDSAASVTSTIDAQ